MDWASIATILGSVVGLMGLQTAVLLWMMSKMDNDIRSGQADSNAKWIAMNARIDQTQSIIMRMLEKRGM